MCCVMPLVSLGVMDAAGHGTPQPCPRCRDAPDPLELQKLMQSGWAGASPLEMGLRASRGPAARPLLLPAVKAVGGRWAAPAARTCGAEQGWMVLHPGFSGHVWGRRMLPLT